MINNGDLTCILKFLEYQNNTGREKICDCGECGGTYVNNRAYVNDDGDFVLSRDTLLALCSAIKYGSLLEWSLDASKNSNFYFAAAKDQNHEDIERNLVKQEYVEDQS